MFSDFKNFKDNSPSKSIFGVILNPCYYSVVLYRISNKLYRFKLSPIAKVIWFINRIIFSVDIDYRANIGKGFRLIHGIGVVIGCNVRIGDNVSIYQGVTLGGCGKKRYINEEMITQPIIGNNTIIYTNSCVFGPVIVRDNSIIKACTIIKEDN